MLYTIQQTQVSKHTFQVVPDKLKSNLSKYLLFPTHQGEGKPPFPFRIASAPLPCGNPCRPIHPLFQPPEAPCCPSTFGTVRVVFDYTLKILKSHTIKDYQGVKILTIQGVFAQSDSRQYGMKRIVSDTLSNQDEVETGENISN